MAYTTVYAPDGTKYEVASRDRADKLILDDGWTQTKPAIGNKVEPKKVSRRKLKASEEVPTESFTSFTPEKPAEDSGDET